MIKVSDLRIGNIIHYTGKQENEWNDEGDVVVMTIGSEKIETEYVHGLSSFIEPELDGFEPIPLTEDWLLQLGFSRSLLPFSEGVYEGPIIDHRVEYNAGSFMYCLWSQHLRNIDHVHQLQNLYHAITGEDLQIK